MPSCASRSPSPIPDNSRTFGESMAPQQTTTSRAGGDPPALAAPTDLDPGAPASREGKPRRLGAVDQAQVAPAFQSRIEIGGRHVVTQAVLDVEMMPAGTFHLWTIEVIGARESQLLAGVEESLGGRVRLVQSCRLHPQRPAMAGDRASVVLLVLQLLEVRQHIVVAPARTALVGPGVEIRPVTPDVHHDVEIAGSARQPPAWLRQPPAVQVRLRDALVRPVGDRLLDERPGPRRGDVVAHRLRKCAAARLHRRPRLPRRSRSAGPPTRSQRCRRRARCNRTYPYLSPPHRARYRVDWLVNGWNGRLS